LTGHSLGGALAHLAAFDLAQQGYKISNVVTFGAPKAAFLATARVYNAARANVGEQSLGALTFCIVNQRDLVPRVPPKLLGFRNVGQGILIDHEDRLHVGVEIDSILLDIVNVAPPPETPLPALLRQRMPESRVSKRNARASSGMGKQVLEVYLNVARIMPPLLLPLIYVRALFEIGSSGANHLSVQYVRAFFGNTQPPISCTPESFWWSRLLKRIFVLLLAMAVLAGFIWTCLFAFEAFRR
jgi:hypothetical protein